MEEINLIKKKLSHLALFRRLFSLITVISLTIGFIMLLVGLGRGKNWLLGGIISLMITLVSTISLWIVTHNYGKENRKFICAVYSRSFENRVRHHLLNKLFHKIKSKRRTECGNYQWPKCVNHTKFGHNYIIRYCSYRGIEHKRQYDQIEYYFSSVKSEFAKRVSAHRWKYHMSRGADHRYKYCVTYVSWKRNGWRIEYIEQIFEIL